MDIVVNQSNELWKSDGSNWKLATDVPELVYSRNITTSFRITTDGRLYDAYHNQYTKFNDCQDQRDFKFVLTDSSLCGVLFALKNNGDLYTGDLHHDAYDEISINNFKLIDTEVEWITTGSNDWDDMISIKGKTITVYLAGEFNKTLNLADDEIVVDVYPGVVVTNTRFITDNVSVNRKDILVRRSHEVCNTIGCGVRINHKTEHYLITVEEIDNRVIIDFTDLTNSLTESSYIRSEVKWIDVIMINNMPCLLSEEGHTVELFPDNRVVETKIPTHILRNNSKLF